MATNTSEYFVPPSFFRGTLISVSAVKKVDLSGKTWFRTLIHRFRSYYVRFIGLGLFANILSLSVPLFVKGVYDLVIPVESDRTLGYLCIGLAIALCVHHFLHTLKSRSIAYMGARLNMIMGISSLRKILYLPTSMVEGASVGNQISRIKQFDSVREIFTGALAQIIIDGPFTLLFLLALGILGGPIVIIPIFLIILFIITSLILLPLIRETTNQVASKAQQKQSFLIESITNLQTLKNLGLERLWLKKFYEHSKENAAAQSGSEEISLIASNLSQIYMKAAGIATIVWGALRVMDDLMTVGSLVAVVLLVWRALSPLQAAFMVLSRIDLVRSSVDQLNQLMRFQEEPRNHISHIRPRISGPIRLQNIHFRYPNESSYALSGVSMEARNGEVVAIIGPNGSGKSTIIKLLLGFYTPQGGSITIDNMDIQHFDPVAFRQSISYVPNEHQFFHGTISQNIRLSAPDATQEEVELALSEAGVLDDILKFPKGVDTYLTEKFLSQLSYGFKQKINLARAYVRKADILIFDEPGNGLDMECDTQLYKQIENLKGKKTIILITHRPSLIKLSDRTLVLDKGQMRVFGPTPKVLSYLEESAA